jgi:hypothetical protein
VLRVQPQVVAGETRKLKLELKTPDTRVESLTSSYTLATLSPHFWGAQLGLCPN